MTRQDWRLWQAIDRFILERPIRSRVMAVQGIVSLITLALLGTGMVNMALNAETSSWQGMPLLGMGGGVLVYLALQNLVALVLLHWLVFAPTKEFLASARRIAGGDFTYRIPVRGSDEISATAKAFNEMAEHLLEHEKQIAARAEVLTAEISERQRAEYSLRIFEKALQTMNLGVTIADTTGRIIFSNPAEARMHGYSVAELIGQPARMLAPSNQAKPLSPERVGALAGWQRETINLRKDGTTFPVQLLSDVVKDAEGNPIGLVTSCLDITERKRAELALQRANEQLEARIAERTAELSRANELLQASEERFRAIFEQAAIGIGLLDLQGYFVRCNHEMERFLGYSEHELKGLKFERLTHPNDRQSDLELAQQLLNGIRRHYQIEKRFQRKDGQLVSGRLTVSLMRNAEGMPQYGIEMVEDITERVKAEETLRKLSRAVEQSPVSIVITDTTGSIEYVNPRFSQLTGYTFEESLGKNPNLLKSGMTPPEVYQDLWNTIVRGGEWKGDFINRKKNGELYRESATISPIVDYLGKVTHFVAVKEDVTERYRAEQALAKRANELATLYETSLIVNSQTDLTTLLHTIIRHAAELTGGDVGSLHLLEDDGEKLRLVVGWQLDPSFIGSIEELNEGIAGMVARNGEEMVNNDYMHWTGKAGPYAQMDVECVLGVPLKTRQKVIGTIMIANFHREEPFAEEQIRLARLFADQAAISVEHTRLYNDVQKLAITDELTGIYNRRGLYQFGEREFERARRFRRPLSAIMFDIDRFKLINDRYSHAAGDLVLRALADCSIKNARRLDIVGRYGGEEFILLLPETDILTASYVAERLRGSIQNTVVPYERHEICVTASLGVAELTPAMPDLNALISAADRALLTAKDAGRNRVRRAP